MSYPFQKIADIAFPEIAAIYYYELAAIPRLGLATDHEDDSGRRSQGRVRQNNDSLRARGPRLEGKSPGRADGSQR